MAKILDGLGMVRYKADTSKHASHPMEVDIYANGNVYVKGRATNKQLANLIEEAVKGGLPESGGSTHS